jgi:hypothetical protein
MNMGRVARQRRPGSVRFDGLHARGFNVVAESSVVHVLWMCCRRDIDDGEVGESGKE